MTLVRLPLSVGQNPGSQQKLLNSVPFRQLCGGIACRDRVLKFDLNSAPKSVYVSRAKIRRGVIEILPY